MTIQLLSLLESNPAAASSWVPIVVAVIGILSTFLTAYFAWKSNKDIMLKDAEIIRLKEEKEKIQISLAAMEQEVNLDSYALTFPNFVKNWNEVTIKLNELFQETSCNRFLILRAWNGLQAPRYTTAIVQYRQGVNEYSDYIHFELDEDYVGKLAELRRRRMIRVVTDKENESAIGGVYRSENPPVTHSNWYHLNDERLSDGRAIITYCSFATSHQSPFSEREEIKQRLLVNLIRQNFDDPHTSVA